MSIWKNHMCLLKSYFSTEIQENMNNHVQFRDRPFNLQGGLQFFVSFRNIFSDNTRVFCRAKHKFFFQNKTLGYMTKTLNQIFFSSTKIIIFFSATLGIRIFFQKKNHNPSLQVKWSFPQYRNMQQTDLFSQNIFR